MIGEEELRRRVARLSVEQKVRLLTGAGFWALYDEPDAGLRAMVVSDGPAGVRGQSWDERDSSANVPSATALAATWDPGRIEAIGALLAREARRKGVDVLLAPTVNLHRTPYAGRSFECFSEDPLLTARIGAAYVRGLQRSGVGACVKHFVGNDSETQRMTVDVRIDERPLRELYLAPFEAICREAGAWSVMAAYNGVNGSTMTESPLLRDILHGEWGWDGLVVSDWTAARSTEATGQTALDLVMPGPADRFGPWGDALAGAVRDGKVDEALIDDKVLRILRLAARVGALAETQDPPGRPAPAPAGPAGHDAPDSLAVAQELRTAAAAGFVLARNDGILPLARSVRSAGTGLSRPVRIALIGPNAEVATTMGGGSATVHPPYTVSPLEGLRAAGLHVTHAAGVYSYTRVPAARAPWLLRPDRSGAGAEVRFFGESGELIGSELRDGATFLWLGGFGPASGAEPVARLEIHCVIRATEAGTYRLGVSGLGRSRLLADGVKLLDATLAAEEGADAAQSLTTPPQALAPVPLAQGQSVTVVIEHDVPSGLSFATFLQVNLEPPHSTDDVEIAAAATLAASSDVAVVVVGTTAEVESEGFDRASLSLPGRQDELVRRVAAANPRTVVVVNSGAPVLLPWAEDAAAVLLSWFGGQELGNALADVLLGEAEPGGRLPVTWPATEEGLPRVQPDDGALAYTEGLFIGYRGCDRDGREPRFAFGHGTGYTTWSYESITVDRDVPGAGGPGGVSVSVAVRNTGARRGREVVQVYASRPGSAVERPAKWLAGFAAVDADPGESVTVGILIPERAFQHWSGRAWATEPGTFTLAAGPSSAALPLTAGIERA
ncbi:MAG TPA: glycoside hydrolase family 3 C-terminal domain-containing protein [Streptosporangiaceae bacterium]|nr:glycoside hydrolase family 3 C-terminal domain-containing protein [Streptosporangiaceae bacterium]